MQVTEELNIKVCTLEGIILLKLLSNNDRRSEPKTSLTSNISYGYILIFIRKIFTRSMYDTRQDDYLQLVCSRHRQKTKAIAE
jgi:hypothetical protein